MLNSIRIESEMISLEAFAPTQILSAVTARLPNLVDKVSQFVSSKLSPTAGDIALVDGSKAAAVLKEIRYVDLREEQVYVSPGQRVNHLHLIEVLEICEKNLIDRLLKDALLPFDTFVAVQLTNPEQLSSLRTAGSIPGFVEHDLENHVKRLGACYDPKSLATTKAFGKVIERNADWGVVVKRTNDLSERALRFPRKEVIDITDRITKNMATLIERIRDEESGYKLSPAITTTLANICYKLAREIEFYSVYMYQLKLHAQAVADTATLIEKKKA